MADITQLSDEELQALASQIEQPAATKDLSSYTDQELEAMLPPEAAPDPGFLARLADSFTGNSRKTKEIESLPDWRTNMPEFELSQGLPAIKTALGTISTDPEETVQIIKSNFPDVQIGQDSKGNFILKSGIDQKDYAIKPGFRASDIPRAVAQVLQFLPAGRATTLVGAGAANALTQAAVEASQSATGGEFNIGSVGAAGALGAAGEAAAKILGLAIPGAKRLLQGKSFLSEDAAALLNEAAQTDLNELVRNAASDTIPANKHQRQLAELAKINPDALQAAADLGIELPVDVFSDNRQLRQIVGMHRAVKGSEASEAWRDSIVQAVNRADDILGSIEAGTEPSVLSDKVLTSLRASRDNLKAETSSAYGQVDSAIPAKTLISAVGPDGVPVEGFPGLQNLRSLLSKTLEDRGGINGLTSQEKGLLNMVEGENVTYGRLLLEKNDLRRALRGKQTPYSNMDQSLIERLYNAVSKDQLDAVEQIAGIDARDKLIGANLLYTKQKQLEKTIIDAFGKDQTGNIVSLMKNAISGVKTGDQKAFNKLLSIVPEPLQKEAVLSAIANYTKATSGEFSGKFGLSQFANTWNQLSERPDFLSKIANVVGSETFDALNGIGRVTNLINRAASEISQTGASNQAYLNNMRATTFMENLVSKIGQSTAAVVGGKLAGPVGFGIGLALPKVFKAPVDRVAAAGKMFNSSEFQGLMKDIAIRGVPTRTSLGAFLESRPFSKFARLASLPADISSKARWVKQAMMSQQDMDQPQAAFLPMQTVAEVLPNGSVKTDSKTNFKILQRPGGKFRLMSPDGTVSIYSSEDDAIRAATKRLRQLTNSPLK